MKYIYFVVLFLYSSFAFTLYAQFINAYAKVTTISGNTLTLSDVDELSDTFENGENIILMQVQGDVLGNTTNTIDFGDISAIGVTGRYEICQILSVTEMAGIPTSITLSSPTTHTYVTNANSSVQIISFPTLGTAGYTTVANMQAKNWDGNKGGVLAFEVAGVLNLAHNLSADGAGFRGGMTSVNDGSGCNGIDYIVTSLQDRYGQKGEGIYKPTNINHQYAKGKLLNGGGGGNFHNGGGGGGSNFTSGGDGGPGWNGSASGCSPTGGGIGGITLGIYTSGKRVFLGGGGGGGQQNNSVGSAGANGGGIILLKAQQVRTAGTGSILISANGNNSNNAGNDGVGGAGAGGSIILQVDAWNVSSTYPITIRANGGNGGNVNSSVHGGGGGGGQGLIIFSGAIPTSNMTTNTINGIGGCNDSGCSSKAQNGAGTNNAGIFGNLGTSLPMTLKSFTANLQGEQVHLQWEVVTYVPIQYFEVEKSIDAISWQSVIRKEANAQTLAYETWDKANFSGKAYYRLKQVGNAQEIVYSNIVAIKRNLDMEDIQIYPNPAIKNVYVELANPLNYQLKIRNALGQEMPLKATYQANNIEIDLNNYKKGVYFVHILTKNQIIVKKLIVQ